MKGPNSFWISSAPQWEQRRYRGLFSRLFFSSLYFRRKYLLFILNQLPPGTRVLELGCGSGLLFGELSEPKNLNYTGVDISPEAIKTARKNFAHCPNANWIQASAETLKGTEYDYVVSAGFLDWVSDEVVVNFLRDNKTRYHVHSFSLNSKTAATAIHRIFSRLVSRKSNINYDPRKFQISEIQTNFAGVGPLQIIRDRKLSFGAFAHNLPESINSSFADMLVAHYFAGKKPGLIEKFLKKRELAAVQNHMPAIAGLAVLEAGSGQGDYSRRLLKQRPRQLLCVDAFVNTACFVPGLAPHFRQIRAEEVKDGPFDLIMALGILEFNRQPVQLLKHLTDLLAPRGRLLLLVPRNDALITRIYRWIHRIRGIEVPARLENQVTHLLNLQKASFEKIDGGPLNFLFIIGADE